MRDLMLGSLCLSLAQLFIGVNIVIGKYLTGFMSMYTFIFIRFFICAVVLGILYRRGLFTMASPSHPVGSLTRRDWLLVIGQGLCAGLLFNIIFYHGLQYTTATSAGIVACSLPAVMTVMAVLFLGENLTLQKLSAILLAILGVMIINIDNFVFSVPDAGSLYGDIVIFAAMIPEALYSILNKKAGGRINELGSALVSGSITSLGIAPFLFLEMNPPQPLPGVMSWPLIAYPLLLLSGLLTIVFYPLWGKGLKNIPVSSAAVFGGVVSIATSTLGFAFLGENFALGDGIGMTVIFTALLVGTFRRPVPQLQD